MSKCSYFFILLFLVPAFASSQSKEGATGLAASVDAFNNNLPAEKVYLQFDKPYYSSADTIWMKAYVLDAALNYSKQSGLLYTELVNDTGKVVLRQCMPVKLGISFGQMALDPSTVPEGSYTIRAYTNWMQNQGEQSFFTRPIYISNTTNDAWLVNTDHKFNSGNMQLALQLTDINKQPVRLREMQLKVMDGNKVLNKDNLQTDIDGKINVNFSLPGKNSDLRVIAQDMHKGEGNQKLVVPITINRPGNADLQFMPEGGQMVAGLRCWIGFKAIGEDGKGTDIKGDIVNSKGVVITSFQSLHKGMGVFEMVPEAGESYTAKVTLLDGTIKPYPLPAVKPSGISMHINNPADVDSIVVIASSSADIINSTEKYSLIGQSGGKVCYAANLSFADGAISGKISKERFVSGITKFTLFNAHQIPIAERLVFIDHHDRLNISIKPYKRNYQPKDSIALDIKVTDKNNRPVIGSFSLAVTDDSQIKADSTDVPDINSYMLLNNDLKGDVEEPGYYFGDKNTDKQIALDNLLLTQGWIAYDWATVFNPQYQPPYKAEPEIAVAGQISRVGGKALGGLTVSLMSAKPFFMKDTVSNAAGRFVFTNLPAFDTIAFALQVKDKKGKIFEANIQADEFTPAKATALNLPTLTPWYVNSDSTLLNYMVKSRAYNQELDKINYPEGTRHLKEVKINALKVVKGSHNLNGPGNADQVLDEQDMIKLGKMSLFDLLMKRINGFHERDILPAYVIPEMPSRAFYAVFDKQVRFVIDGTDIDLTYSPAYRTPLRPDSLRDYDYFNFEKSIIELFSAEDIRGIEILYNNTYTGKYKVMYDSQLAADPFDWNSIPPSYALPVYIEITTWSGQGLFEKRKHGTYVYRPLPISWPKQFYKPKYTAKSNNTLADLRSTIDWEPNIITDTSGKATIWFYAKGKPSAYTVILQGSDLSGNVGSKKTSIVIK